MQFASMFLPGAEPSIEVCGVYAKVSADRVDRGTPLFSVKNMVLSSFLHIFFGLVVGQTGVAGGPHPPADLPATVSL